MHDEETDTDDVRLIEKPAKKRTRGMCPNSPPNDSYIDGLCIVLSPEVQEHSGPEFVQGSSQNKQPDGSTKDQELDSLARLLDHSASFEESSRNVWLKNENAELEEDRSNDVWHDKNAEQYGTF